MSVTDVGTSALEYVSNEPVEGQRLSDRLVEGTLPPEEALSIALQVGMALHRAHLQGLVHGRVSPAAVVLSADGVHLLQPQCVEEEVAASYRSPEQVRELPADWRSDIFSYGSLLYEMVGGRRAFPGSGAELETAIVRRPAAVLNAKTPIHAAMEGVIAGCMQKEPGARRQRMQNAVTELKLAGRSAARTVRLAAIAPAVQVPTDQASRSGETHGDSIRPAFRPQVAPQRHAPRRWAMVVLAVVALLAVVAVGAMYLMRDRASKQVIRFRIPPPQSAGYCGVPAISPDGHYVACAAPGAHGQPVLWLRGLDETKWTSIDSTEGAFAPFWSPDSQYVGFFAKGLLRRLEVRNGAFAKQSAALSETGGNGGGASWSSQGVVLFAPGQEGGLSRIPATGGKPQSVLKLHPDKDELAFLWPQFLPDGKHFLFYVQTSIPETSGVAVGTLDPPSYHFLVSSDSNGVYSGMAGGDAAKRGYLLFIQDRNLRGQEFSPSKLTLTGQPTTLATDVGLVSSLALAPISVSSNAILTYQKVDAPTRQLVWMDRAGKQLGTVADAGKWGPPRISPDGKSVAVGKRGADDHDSDLWLIDAEGNASLFLATPGVSEGMPLWSPDGSRVAFWSNRNGVYDIFVKPVKGGKEEALYQSAATKYPTDWTRDGAFVMFDAIGEGTGNDIWTYSLRDHRGSPIIQTIHHESYSAVSPDGKWLAYQSDETGRNEVYVQPFDPGSSETKRRLQVSGDNGGMPRWRADGAELFYMTNAGHFMVCAVHPKNGLFEFDAPRELFQIRPMRPFANLYDVSPDGQRFLVNAPLERAASANGSDGGDIMVVTNWTEKVK